MSDSKPANGPSWWQTLPGILTGLAAIVTAVTGLIVAFNRTSSRSEPVAPTSSASPPPVSREATARATPPESQPSGAIVLPPLHEVKLAGGATVVTILSAQVAPIDAARRTLTFDVRYMNAGRFPANFWDKSYRLIVDGVLREPTNSLDEVVGPDSAKEGEVVFELPRGAKDVTLQISSGDDKTRLPFKLP